MNKQDWTTLLEAFRIVAPALAGYAVVLLRSLLKEARDTTRSIAALQQWTETHEKMDDTRWNDLRRELDFIQTHLGKGVQHE